MCLLGQGEALPEHCPRAERVPMSRAARTAVSALVPLPCGGAGRFPSPSSVWRVRIAQNRLRGAWQDEHAAVGNSSPCDTYTAVMP